MNVLALPPRQRSEAARIALTASCRDTDDLPKVADAGEVVTVGGERVQIMHNGLRVLADGYYGAWMTDLIGRLRGHHEPQEERAFHEVLCHLPDQATMLEVGAYWSYYALWFLKERPHGRALALEPDPAHLALGQRNAALNDLPLGFRQGIIARGAAARIPFQTESSGVCEVDAIPLEMLVDTLGGRVDLLLCDAQGGEIDLVHALAPLVADRRIGMLVLSTHAQPISGDALTHQRCLSALKDLQADILVEHDVHESFSGDGLIVAAFGGVPEAWCEPTISRNRYETALFRNPLYDLAELQADLGDRISTTTLVHALYRQLLGREADPAGLEYHVRGLRQSGDVEALVRNLMASAEFSQRGMVSP